MKKPILINEINKTSRKCAITRCNKWIEDENYPFRTCEKCREKSRLSVRKLRSNPDKYIRDLKENKERHNQKYKEDIYYRLACQARRREQYSKNKKDLKWLEEKRKKDRESWNKRKQNSEYAKKVAARARERRKENKLLIKTDPIVKKWIYGMLEYAKRTN